MNVDPGGGRVPRRDERKLTAWVRGEKEVEMVRLSDRNERA